MIPKPHVRPYSGRDLRIDSQLRALGSFADIKLIELGGETFADAGSTNTEGGKKGGPTSAQMVEILRQSQKPFFYNATTANLKKVMNAISEFCPDLMIFSGIESASIHAHVREFTSIPFILDLDETVHRWSNSFQNADVPNTLKFAWKNYFPILRNYEDNLLTHFAQVWVSSQIEKTALDTLHESSISINVIPNSLYFEREEEDFVNESDSRKPMLLFVGTFSHLPNILAVEEIVTRIAPSLEDFDFEIVGREMPKEWLNQNQVLNIKFSPNVSELEPFYKRAMASIIPIRTGAGTRYKALEAMAHGVPIISSRFGVEGLDLIDGNHYLCAETQEEFAFQAIRLLQDCTLKEELVKNSRIHFEKNFSIQALERKLGEALQV